MVPVPGRAGGVGRPGPPGVPRSEVNRAYFRLFAGASRAETESAGRAWYAGYRRRPAAFVAATAAALEGHRRAGDAVVLVSGSFAACLAPLADDLGADRLLCTEPVVARDGLLTGEVRRPMIGAAKAEAVAATVAQLGLDAAECFCYADHASDLPMLRAVGHPRVVGRDAVLLARAREGRWPVLPAGVHGKDRAAGGR